MKILAIGAHQDDNEFRCGGAAALWTKAGHEVRFLSMCNGCGGHHVMTPEETSARRGRESAAVAEYLGIRYDVWDIDDCTLMPTLEYREKLVRYIREYSPDLIISHRTIDYHADHRAAAQLVADASYILTVPHSYPDSPAMAKMPVIIYYEDKFKNPEFDADFVIAIDSVIEDKLHIAHLNESQVYEWLPYNNGYTDVPTEEESRKAWLRGMDITEKTTDKEVMAAGRGYAVRYAKTAARFRKKLIKKYGFLRGRRIRYAEAFSLSEYGSAPSPELLNSLFEI